MSDSAVVVDGIRADRHGPVGLIWLARPDRGNGFTTAMQIELHRQLAELDEDEAIRVIIVTGEGKLFSAGADMEPGGSNFAFDQKRHREAKAEIAARPRPWRMRTPIIGALNGSAVGLGLTFPLQWDIRIVNESAKYGFVFTRRGLIPEQNSLWLLPRLVGLSTATELLLTGRLFSGAEAARMGLATEAVPGERVLDRALAIAADIATNTAPSAVGVTKQLLYDMLAEGDREAAFGTEWEVFRWMGRQPDSAEGVASFLEKRTPNFAVPKDIPLPDELDGWEAS
ncbi:enoyl-CoA hydratase-related protein [Mycobacterium sp. NBC_00419]|uniref:enoyl-CoA hydratase-related protein n=1 Tax=Mycobacterium sp. NBC_00419 TaxID=2975989 RepID=UPI002E214CB2